MIKRLLTLMCLGLACGSVAAQGLGAVLSSIQERHMLIYTNPIQWVGVPEDNENLKKFPDEAYLAGLGIEDRIKLLA